MKKLGLLIVFSFFMTACDIKPGGNKGILPVAHDGNMEQLDQTAEPAEETPASTGEAVEEKTGDQTENTAGQVEETTADEQAKNQE